MDFYDGNKSNWWASFRIIYMSICSLCLYIASYQAFYVHSISVYLSLRSLPPSLFPSMVYLFFHLYICKYVVCLFVYLSISLSLVCLLVYLSIYSSVSVSCFCCLSLSVPQPRPAQISLTPSQPADQPPTGTGTSINWPPDGRHLALFPTLTSQRVKGQWLRVPIHYYLCRISSL